MGQRCWGEILVVWPSGLAETGWGGALRVASKSLLLLEPGGGFQSADGFANVALFGQSLCL